jgi:hypothetical protein
MLPFLERIVRKASVKLFCRLWRPALPFGEPHLALPFSLRGTDSQRPGGACCIVLPLASGTLPGGGTALLAIRGASIWSGNFSILGKYEWIAVEERGSRVRLRISGADESRNARVLVVGEVEAKRMDALVWMTSD